MARGAPEPVFLSSITDLMTSLAVIFIMLLIFFIKKEYAEAARAEAVSKQLDIALMSSRTLKDELKRRLASEGYPAEDDPKDSLAIVYHAGDDNLQFDVDRDELKSNGEAYLDEFIPALVSVVTDDEIYPALRSVLIEGHTDSDGDDEHNLHLSQGRAFSVLKYGLNSCGLKRYQRERFLDLTSINGRGERDLLPLGSEAGEENKSQSRRVEFKIRVRSFEEKDKEFSELRTRLKEQADQNQNIGSKKPVLSTEKGDAEPNKEEPSDKKDESEVNKEEPGDKKDESEVNKEEPGDKKDESEVNKEGSDAE